MKPLDDLNTKNIELLAPAGDYEKLEIAVHFGADAVYLAGKNFSLRNFSGNFSSQEMSKGIEYAHKNNVKVYVACNSFVRNADLSDVTDFLLSIGEVKPDGIIIADPGVVNLARKHIPDIPIHLSTQANTTNLQSVMFWQDMGVKRINMARELPLENIREIAKQTSMEIEAFVHGAMCIAYSGRCLLSSYMANRDSNQGMCAHPCRWKYAVVEEKRPHDYMPIAEDDQGAYIFSSKDLCMIDHIPEMIQSNIHSLKIEGRMKGIYYLATVLKTYREAIDAYYSAPDNYRVNKLWLNELSLINHREYSTGFYFGDPSQTIPNYKKSHIFEGHLFIGKITGDNGDNCHIVEVRNKMIVHEPVEVLSPNHPPFRDSIVELTGPDGKPMEVAQPGQQVFIKFNNTYSKNDIIRKSTPIPV